METKELELRKEARRLRLRVPSLLLMSRRMGGQPFDATDDPWFESIEVAVQRTRESRRCERIIRRTGWGCNEGWRLA